MNAFNVLSVAGLSLALLTNTASAHHYGGRVGFGFSAGHCGAAVGYSCAPPVVVAVPVAAYAAPVSYAAPVVSYTAPVSYAAPVATTYEAPVSYAAPLGVAAPFYGTATFATAYPYSAAFASRVGVYGVGRQFAVVRVPRVRVGAFRAPVVVRAPFVRVGRPVVAARRPLRAGVVGRPRHR